jgi:hypothetical protein
MNDFDSIAIAKIVIFTIYLPISVYLCFKHGWRLSQGWLYIVILNVANILGSIFQVATINDPASHSLITGRIVLSSIGLGVLVVVLLALIERLFTSANRQGEIIRPLYRRIISLLMLIAMILSIVGGFQTKRENGEIHYSGVSVASMGLMTAVLVFITIEIYHLLKNYQLVPEGERRIFIAAVVSMPFLIVRQAYSCYLVYNDKKDTVGIYLGMAVIPDMAIVLMYQILGLVLARTLPAHSQLRQSEEGVSMK